jgi:hypothetical protein
MNRARKMSRDFTSQREREREIGRKYSRRIDEREKSLEK